MFRSYDLCWTTQQHMCLKENCSYFDGVGMTLSSNSLGSELICQSEIYAVSVPTSRRSKAPHQLAVED